LQHSHFAVVFVSQSAKMPIHSLSRKLTKNQRDSAVAKTKEQKKKEREKRVAQKKLVVAAKRREIAKQSETTDEKGARGKKVITAGVKQQPQAQVTSAKPNITHRRAGG
jgi:hypothetical protein